MTLDELAGLLKASRFLPPGAGAASAPASGAVEREALRAVPELVDGLPPVLFDARGPHVWSGCTEVLRAPLSGLGAAVMAEAGRPVGGADRALADDPLVVLLARLVVEGASFSPGAAVVPLLEVVRGAWVAMGEPAALALFQATPEAGGERLGFVAAGVQARLAAACAKASGTVRVPALAWALSRSRLLPLYARGSLDRDPSWARVAAVLGVPLPAGTVEAVQAAIRLAIKGLLERRAANKMTADDAALVLRALPPGRLDAGADAAAAALLLDPDALMALLPSLGRFVDARALVAANVAADRAAGLLTPAGGLAVASVLLDVLAALRTWDVLSQLVGAVGAPQLRPLVVPRGAPAIGAVVAVGLGRLRADPTRAHASDAAWEGLVTNVEGGVVADLGVAGLVAFPDAVDAMRFALLARRRLEGAAVAVSHGSIVGGTDGAVTRLSGPAVEAAIRWVAVAPAAARVSNDELVVRLRQVGGWLCGDGLAIDAPAEAALQDSRVRRGLATKIDGPPGGDPRVLHSLDVLRVYEFDGAVLAIVRIPGVAGGFEALTLSAEEWRELLDRDGERAEASSVPSAALPVDFATPVQALDESNEALSGEESVEWEMAESEEFSDEVPVLDLEEHPFDAPPPPPPSAEPRFEFDEEGDDAASIGDASSFSGFYLPGAENPAAKVAATLPRSSATRAGPDLSSFEMEVEDEDDETQEWGVPPADVTPAPPAGRENPAQPVPPSLADFVYEPAGSPSIPPASDDLRDPATPVSVARWPAYVSFGGSAAAPPTAAPVETDPFAAAARAVGEPEPSSSAPSALPSPLDSDPFADFTAELLSGPFDQADPFAASPPPVAPPPAAPVPAPAAAEPTGDARSLSSGGRIPGASGVHSSRSVSGSVDFDFLLRGYACFFDKKEAVFGRPYGTRIVDRHVYPYRGDPDEVYAAFLRDKIQEGFVPHSERIGDLPRGVTVMPLDADAMQRVWKELS
ncbi:MAG: hypothetical protein Q8P18_28335 [Pseudomonadota bacterium]|nr:hypothetical protein [Pseudomonadota bacterium]